MDPVKAEKQTAMRRYRRIRTVGRLFRCLEICAAIMIISWSSTRLPAAAKLSGDFLRAAVDVILSSRFVFLLGNAIVLVLFVKSGNLSSSPASSSAGAGGSPARAGDIYDEFLETRSRIFYPLPTAAAVATEDVFEDKAVCVEARVCRRTRSENMEKRIRRGEAEVEWKVAELRRSETDVDRKGAVVVAAEKEEDAEEFRRTVEAFIAKELKFRRQESMAVVSAATVTPLPESDLAKQE